MKLKGIMKKAAALGLTAFLTLGMPVEPLIATVHAEDASKINVEYVDENGMLQSVDAIKLSSLEKFHGACYKLGDGSTNGTWYYLDEDLSRKLSNDYYAIDGTVNIILGDDHTLQFGTDTEQFKVERCFTNHSNKADLHIYGQRKGTGKILAYPYNDAFGNLTSFTQHSGSVEIKPVNNSSNIFNGIQVNGDVDIKGGSLFINSPVSDCISAHNISIEGGQVEIITGGAGKCLESGEDNNITLSYNKVTDYIKLTYTSDNPKLFSLQGKGVLNIADGQLMVDENGNEYSGATYNTSNVSAINSLKSLTLKPKTCEVSYAANGGIGEQHNELIICNKGFALPPCLFIAPGGKEFKEWSVKVGNSAAVSKLPGDNIVISADTVLTAVWKDKAEFGEQKNPSEENKPVFVLTDTQKKNMANATIIGVEDKVYTGKAIKQKITVMMGDTVLKEKKDYTVKYKNNKKCGTATVTVKGKGNAKHGIRGSKSVTFTISKAPNPLDVTGKTATVKVKKPKKVNITVSKLIKIVKKGKGKLSYEKISGDANITINAKNGKATVAKGTPAGTYPIEIRVTAKGDKNYGEGSYIVKSEIVSK